MVFRCCLWLHWLSNLWWHNDYRFAINILDECWSSTKEHHTYIVYRICCITVWELFYLLLLIWYNNIEQRSILVSAGVEMLRFLMMLLIHRMFAYRISFRIYLFSWYSGILRLTENALLDWSLNNDHTFICMAITDQRELYRDSSFSH